MYDKLAREVLTLCEEISRFSAFPQGIKRYCLTPEMDALHSYLQQKYKDIFYVQTDKVGNILFRNKKINKNNRKNVLIGSHLDTVDNAGKYDGILGVAIGLVVANKLNNSNAEFSVVGFSDEEGARFGCRFIGSLNFVDKLPESYLEKKDVDGISLGHEVLKRMEEDKLSDFSNYLKSEKPIFIEPHIEQGLQLDKNNKSLGLVEKISGQTLCTIIFTGKSTHAVDKWSRQDSLVVASKLISQAHGLTLYDENVHITLGSIENYPNQSNVVSSKTIVKVDIRHVVEQIRKKVLQRLLACAKGIAIMHDTNMEINIENRETSIMNKNVLKIMKNSCRTEHIKYHPMHSYAGHDAMILNGNASSGLLFLRDRKGISHHPDELILMEDIVEALRFFHRLSNMEFLIK